MCILRRHRHNRDVREQSYFGPRNDSNHLWLLSCQEHFCQPDDQLNTGNLWYCVTHIKPVLKDEIETQGSSSEVTDYHSLTLTLSCCVTYVTDGLFLLPWLPDPGCCMNVDHIFTQSAEAALNTENSSFADNNSASIVNKRNNVFFQFPEAFFEHLLLKAARFFFIWYKSFHLSKIIPYFIHPETHNTDIILSELVKSV